MRCGCGADFRPIDAGRTGADGGAVRGQRADAVGGVVGEVGAAGRGGAGVLALAVAVHDGGLEHGALAVARSEAVHAFCDTFCLIHRSLNFGL